MHINEFSHSAPHTGHVTRALARDAAKAPEALDVGYQRFCVFLLHLIFPGNHGATVPGRSVENGVNQVLVGVMPAMGGIIQSRR